MHNAGWEPAPGDARVVDEDVLISLVGGYEPVTLLLRKPLHRSLGHCLCARLSLLLGSPFAENPPSTSAASIPTSRRTSMRRHILSRPTWRPRRGRALRLLPFALCFHPHCQ